MSPKNEKTKPEPQKPNLLEVKIREYTVVMRANGYLEVLKDGLPGEIDTDKLILALAYEVGRQREIGSRLCAILKQVHEKLERVDQAAQVVQALGEAMALSPFIGSRVQHGESDRLPNFRSEED